MSSASAYEYGVLFSHASTSTAPELVTGPYPDIYDAMEHAGEVTRAQTGITHSIMRRIPNGPWTAVHGGLTAEEELARLTRPR